MAFFPTMGPEFSRIMVKVGPGMKFKKKEKIGNPYSA